MYKGFRNDIPLFTAFQPTQKNMRRLGLVLLFYLSNMDLETQGLNLTIA